MLHVPEIGFCQTNFQSLSPSHTPSFTYLLFYLFYVGSQLPDGLINEFQFGPKHDLLKFTQDGKEMQRWGEGRRDNHSAAYMLAFIKPALLD